MNNTKVTSKLVRNPYLSEQEEKLAKFCEKNGISFVKRSDPTGRGKSHYELDFKPEFLDETEARVCQHLDRNGIKYRFAVDKGGTHHYAFDKMVELEPLDSRGEVIVDRKYVEHCIAEMPKLRRDYKRELKLLEDDGQVKEIKRQIDKIKSQIEDLKKNTDLVKWHHRLWYAVWKPFRTKVDDRVKKSIRKLECDIQSKESHISCIEAERLMFRDMLVLADIIPDDETPKTQDEKEVLNEAVIMAEAKYALKEAERTLGRV